MPEIEQLGDLIARIERMNGKVTKDGNKITYLGDGINHPVTSVELLFFLRQLLNTLGKEAYVY